MRCWSPGDVRAIGVSSFKPAHLQRVLDETGIIPDVNQIQLSPYGHPSATAETFNQAHGIVTESWSPLGASSGELRNDPVITSIAAGVREIGNSGSTPLACPARAGGHPEVGKSRPDRRKYRHLRLRADGR